MSRAEFERRLRPRPIDHGYAVRQDVAGPGWTLIYPSGETRTGHATRAAAEKRAEEHRRVTEPSERERELRRELWTLETLAPRFSEGAISATQLNRMSKRQQDKYQRDMSRRYEVEKLLKEERKPPEQRAAEAKTREAEAARKQRRERLAQVESAIRFRESVGHRGIGGTKKRNLEIYEGLLAEREQLRSAERAEIKLRLDKDYGAGKAGNRFRVVYYQKPGEPERRVDVLVREGLHGSHETRAAEVKRMALEKIA